MLKDVLIAFLAVVVVVISVQMLPTIWFLIIVIGVMLSVAYLLNRLP